MAVRLAVSRKALLARLFETARRLTLLFRVRPQTPPRSHILDGTRPSSDENTQLAPGSVLRGAGAATTRQALARTLGHFAGVRVGDQVLDVSGRVGEAAALWHDELGPSRIISLHRSTRHVDAARRRFSDRTRLGFVRAESTLLPFPGSAFDRVLALESVNRLASRQAFFVEAFRVLRPGGVLAFTDVVTMEVPSSLRLAWRQARLRRFWRMPRRNVVPVADIEAALVRVGFVDVQVLDGTEHLGGTQLDTQRTAAHTRLGFRCLLFRARRPRPGPSFY